MLDPVPPIIPIVSPDLICKSTPSSTFRSAASEYLKFTPSKSIEPSFTSCTAFSGLDSVLFSSSISQIRRALSIDMTIITNTMENIMSDISICMPYTMSCETSPTLSVVPDDLSIMYDPTKSTDDSTP